MTARSSATNPTDIAQISTTALAGAIGTTSCPWNKAPSSLGPVWDWNLATDLAQIQLEPTRGAQPRPPGTMST